MKYHDDAGCAYDAVFYLTAALSEMVVKKDLFETYEDSEMMIQEYDRFKEDKIGTPVLLYPFVHFTSKVDVCGFLLRYYLQYFYLNESFDQFLEALAQEEKMRDEFVRYYFCKESVAVQDTLIRDSNCFNLEQALASVRCIPDFSKMYFLCVLINFKDACGILIRTLQELYKAVQQYRWKRTDLQQIQEKLVAGNSEEIQQIEAFFNMERVGWKTRLFSFSLFNCNEMDVMCGQQYFRFILGWNYRRLLKKQKRGLREENANVTVMRCMESEVLKEVLHYRVITAQELASVLKFPITRVESHLGWFRRRNIVEMEYVEEGAVAYKINAEFFSWISYCSSRMDINVTLCSFSKIFTSDTRMALFKLFIPLKELCISDLMEKLYLSKATIYSHIEVMLNERVLEAARGIGNRNYYRINILYLKRLKEEFDKLIRNFPMEEE